MQIGNSVHHNFAMYVRLLNPSLSFNVWNHINTDVWNLVTPVWDSVNDAVRIDVNNEE